MFNFFFFYNGEILLQGKAQKKLISKEKEKQREKQNKKWKQKIKETLSLCG